jgi:hypothetical protein
MRCEGCSGKDLFAEWKQCASAPAGQESEVADANEPTRQHMQQETTQELIGRQYERDEAVIGDRHPMRVSAEVAKYLLGAAERWFAIGHPSRRIKLTDQTPKQFGLSQTAKRSVKPELSGSVSLPERFEKLAAEDFAENPFGKKEPITSRTHPMAMVARQTTGRDNAVNMGMMHQPPTVP